MEGAREGPTDVGGVAGRRIGLGIVLLAEGEYTVAEGVGSGPLDDCTARLSDSTFALRTAAAAAALAAAFETSDSLSPTHVLANHRPPAMPLISRFAVRQRRGLFLLLSSGMMGAKPVPILGGGWTGKGLDGRG